MGRMLSTVEFLPTKNIYYLWHPCCRHVGNICFRRFKMSRETWPYELWTI